MRFGPSGANEGGNYNATQNANQWSYNQGLLDINYLVWVLNQNGHEVEQVTRHKAYTPIGALPDGWTQKTGTARYVSELLDLATFRANDTIVIESCTGTGKTTAIAGHMGQEDGCKFLSIVTRTSLADQHCKSFRPLGLVNYLDLKHSFCDQRALVICLNSLGELESLGDDEIANYVIYIDEVTSLLEFTSNDLLDSVMKKVVVTLTRLIKHAKKVILSDAMVNDGAFELLKHRGGANRLMLKNEFRKFQGTPAIRLRDEQDFLKALKDHCNADLPFLFGCDSANIATKFYHDCIDSLTDPSRKDRFLLTTADTLHRVNNATEDFKDKFVFYSPKITFGVDFSIDVPPRRFYLY